MAEMREQPAMAPRPLDWLNGDVAVLRREYHRQRAKPLPVDAAWITLGGIRVLHHRVEPPSGTAIVYFHGGGFIAGSPLTHADITDALCREAGLPLYSVDYRLAPEHVAPAPIEDGMAVIRHLLANGTDKLILCGDSAGGTIALAVEARLAEPIRWHVAGVCSFYGAHGLFDTASLIERGSRVDGTDVDCVRRYFALATGGRANPYAIDALARPSTVPVYLMAAGDDPLRDDSLRLAEALEAHGRDVTLAVVERENHGFLHDAATTPRAKAAMAQAGDRIRRVSERH